jgi:hypothetical protein
MTVRLITTLGLLAIVLGCGKSQPEPKRIQPKYPVLTAEILQRIPEKELEYAIVDHVASKISDFENALAVVTNLSKGMQMVYSTWWVEGEVNNGGFNQYFWNASGKFKLVALDGFKLLGASEHCELMAEAIRLQEQQEAKLSQLRRNGTLKDFSESYKDNPLNALDTRFYALTEDVGAMRIKYIREHVEEFVTKQLTSGVGSE